MLRHALESLGTLSFRTRRTSAKQFRELSRRTGAGEEDLEAEYAAARKWMFELNRDTIPMSLARISFARSSGAGGQHVNKWVTPLYLVAQQLIAKTSEIRRTNSKAIFNWPMELIEPYIPGILHLELRRSRFYVYSSDSIQISAQTSRSQRENKDECHQKLHELLKDLSKRFIPGETSEAQKQKIEKL